MRPWRKNTPGSLDLDAVGHFRMGGTAVAWRVVSRLSSLGRQSAVCHGRPLLRASVCGYRCSTPTQYSTQELSQIRNEKAPPRSKGFFVTGLDYFWKRSGQAFCACSQGCSQGAAHLALDRRDREHDDREQDQEAGEADNIEGRSISISPRFSFIYHCTPK